MTLTSLEDLRSLYAQPTERVRQKVIPALDRPCRRFIGLLFLIPGIDETLRVNGRAGPDRPGRSDQPEVATRNWTRRLLPSRAERPGKGSLAPLPIGLSRDASMP